MLLYHGITPLANLDALQDLMGRNTPKRVKKLKGSTTLKTKKDEIVSRTAAELMLSTIPIPWWHVDNIG